MISTHSVVRSQCGIDPVMITFLTSLFLLAVPVLGAECPECEVSGTQARCQKPDTTAVPDCLPTNITYLQLYRNNISVLTADSFRNYPNVEILLVEGSTIQSLADDTLSSLPNVIEVQFFNTKLTGTLPPFFYAYSRNVERISLSTNFLESIDKDAFRFTTKLKYVRIDSNRISTLDPELFKYNPDLWNLDISRNQIATLDKNLFLNNPKMQTLNAAYNRLTTIDGDVFKPTPLITNIYFDNNLISFLPANAFQYAVNAHDISLDDNLLTTLDSDIFFYSSSVTNINLSRNKLVDLPPFIFSYNTKMFSVKVDGNQLTTLHSDTFYKSLLLEVDFRENLIKTLRPEVFANLTNIEYIFMEGNPWVCDCRLKPFVDLIVEKPFDMWFYTPLCDTPAELNGVFIVEAVNSLNCTTV